MLLLWGRRNMIDQCLSLLNYRRRYCYEQENCCLLMFLWVMTTLSWCVRAVPADAPGHDEYSCGNTASRALLLSCSDLLTWNLPICFSCCLQSSLLCHLVPPCFRLCVLETITRYFQINLSLFTPCTLRITMWSLGSSRSCLASYITETKENPLSVGLVSGQACLI